MFKTVPDDVWVIDAEWVPDVETGRRVHDLPPQTADLEVMERMYREAGATAENPQPYLKTVVCRVVSISAVKRKRTGHHPVQLDLRSLPDPSNAPMPEAELLSKFLDPRAISSLQNEVNSAKREGT